MIKRFLLFILLIIAFEAVRSQNLPIGGWAALLPYRFATDVVQGNGKIYCITSIDIFSVNASDNSIQEYNKVTGLSGTGISSAAYNSAIGVLVIGYTNSNIDLLYDNGLVVNVPAIAQANIIGNRTINSIYFIGTNAYLSCGFGIVNLNLNTRLINGSTYDIVPQGSVNVNSISLLSDTIYAATNNGVYYATTNDSLFLPSSWHLFNSTNGLPAVVTNFVQSFNNRMYAAQNSKTGASIYVLKNNAWLPIYSGSNWTINGITASSTHLVIAEDSGNVYTSKIALLNTLGDFSSAYPSGLGLPLQALQDNTGNIWVADNYNGLLCYQQNGNTQNFTPKGPFTAFDNSMAAYNNNLYIAPTGPEFVFNTDGFFVRSNGQWINVNGNLNYQMSGVYNVTNVVASPNDNTAYFGTFSAGLVHYKTGQNNSAQILNIYNSSNSTLAFEQGNYPNIAIGGMAFDNENNLWVSAYGAAAPISVLETNGTWQAFTPTVSVNRNFLQHMTVDQFDQKWITVASSGILVMNTGTGLSNAASAEYKALGTGVGNGNLPSNNVFALAVDQTGNVWVGTDQGITVFYCPGDVFTTGCDAQQIIYSSSAGNGYLLGTDVINAIIVDGANRKWVGTNTGVYLLSADGSQEIENFNTTNSPLFSNNVISLALDPITGNLFIGTDQGVLEYRTTANEGSDTGCSVSVFPNPVRQNYYGPITIAGVVANATVKITDITGDLVYETTALGGQAIWNGNLQNGNRAKTGVYLVFVSNSDGSVHCMGKFLLVN